MFASQLHTHVRIMNQIRPQINQISNFRIINHKSEDKIAQWFKARTLLDVDYLANISKQIM